MTSLYQDNKTHYLVDVYAVNKSLISIDWWFQYPVIYTSCDYLYNSDSVGYLEILGVHIKPINYFDYCRLANFFRFCELRGCSEIVARAMFDAGSYFYRLTDVNKLLTFIAGGIGIFAAIFAIFLVLAKGKEKYSMGKLFGNKTRNEFLLDILCYIIAIIDILFILIIYLENIFYLIWRWSVKNCNVGTCRLYYPFGKNIFYLLFYFHLVTSAVSTMITTLKSLNQMVSCYLPIFYR